MNKSSSPSLFERLLRRTGGWYPISVLLLMQMVSTLLTLLLIAMPAQQKSEFSKAQGVSLLIFGGIAFSFKNAMLLAQFHHFNRDRVVRLSKISQPS